MKIAEPILFNLFFNSICSFTMGFLLVYLLLKILKIDRNYGHGRWTLFLLSIPFFKICWDIIKGIPESSIIFTGLNPLTLPPKSQTLSIGLGFSDFWPLFSLIFTAFDQNKRPHSLSLADYLSLALQKIFGPFAPSLLLGTFFSLSALFLSQRIIQFFLFERKRKKLRLQDQSLESRKIDRRTVDIYLGLNYQGTPFTGGIFRPYICFPRESYERLNSEERHAVLQHEMAHIKYWDLPLTFLMKCLGDFFWFIPGLSYLIKKIDWIREILADQAAILEGGSGKDMAMALIKISEQNQKQLSNKTKTTFYSAFFREKSILKSRLNCLIGEESKQGPRWGWRNLYSRIFICALTFLTVMTATLAGNHKATTRLLPVWLENFLKQFG